MATNLRLRKIIGESPEVRHRPSSPSLYKHEMKSRISLLEDEEQNREHYQMGMANLMILGGLIFTVQQVVHNYANNGYVINTELLSRLVGTRNLIVTLLLWGVIAICHFFVYVIHLLLYMNVIGETTALVLYVSLQLFVNVGNYIAAHTFMLPPIMAGGTTMQALVHSMKMHSYWKTNNTMRNMLKSGQVQDRDPNFYPHNMNIRDWAYFLVSPTLVYEINFPKVPKFRIMMFLDYLTQAAVALFCSFFIIDHYLMPQFDLMFTGVSATIAAMVRLLIPSMALWCIMFYLIFHCILNLIAEATRFADRQFYLDWWNAVTFESWYRRWNFRVHEFFQRHVYTDIMDYYHLTKRQAFTITFIMSGIMHEIVMSCALHTYTRPWLAMSMICQFIAAYFIRTYLYNSPRTANIVVWICLYIGFPIVELMYISSYVKSQ